MKFESVRFVVSDIKSTVSFYELIMEQTAQWFGETFAQIVTPSVTIGISTMEISNMFKEGIAEPRSNRSAVVEWRVDDVDATFARLDGKVELIHPPKTMPWGNRTFQVRDPEGSAISFFQPVSDEARARYASRESKLASMSS